MKNLTIKSLKKLIKDIPDDTPIRLSSDSGLDSKMKLDDIFYANNKEDPHLSIYINKRYKDIDFDEDEYYYDD